MRARGRRLAATQSLVPSVLFCGYGVGLMDRLGNAAGFGMVIAIVTSQALVRRWWLRAHRFGPLEGLWRTLVYGRRQAWRASRATASIAQAE